MDNRVDVQSDMRWGIRLPDADPFSLNYQLFASRVEVSLESDGSLPWLPRKVWIQPSL